MKKTNASFSATGALLGLFAAGVVVATWPVSGAMLFGALMTYGTAAKISADERRRATYALHYLKREKYIGIRREKNGTVRISLTASGRKQARRHFLTDRMRIPRPKRWDKMWRVIIFDLPAEKRRQRNAIRVLLRTMGAVMLQKSVWAFPYDCKASVRDLSAEFGLSEGELRLMEVSDIGKDEGLRRQFGL